MVPGTCISFFFLRFFTFSIELIHGSIEFCVAGSNSVGSLSTACLPGAFTRRPTRVPAGRSKSVARTKRRKSRGRSGIAGYAQTHAPPRRRDDLPTELPPSLVRIIWPLICVRCVSVRNDRCYPTRLGHSISARAR